MNTAVHLSLPGYGGRGLGQSKADVGVQVGTTAATKVVPQLLGSSVASLLGTSVAVAVPIVGAAIVGLSLGIQAILHSGCGETCIVTSQWANEAEELLKRNVAEYRALAAPRPKSVQQIAMANFQVVWNRLVEQCSQPGLSTAGRNCIADRQDGACKWRDAAGQCWNWWSGYYDPIANDRDTYGDGSLLSRGGPGGALAIGGFDPKLLLIGAGVLVAAVVVSRL
jgi:hypothetical protein